MFTIKRAAETTGVPVATLRAWERRYAIVRPVRTPSGYRLYDQQALADLSAMRDLVAAGWTPSQAATEVTRRRALSLADPTAAGPADRTPPDPGRPAHLDQLAHEQLPVATEASITRFVEAAARLDAMALDRELDEQFSRGSVEHVLTGWLWPALRTLGRAWADRQVGIAGEHLASQAVLRRLAVAYEAAGPSPNGPRIIVGLGHGSRHEIGAMAFALAARRAGATVLYVGPDLPPSDWVAAVRHHRAERVVLAATIAADIPAVTEVAHAIAREFPRVSIGVGGSEADHPRGPVALGLAEKLGPDPVSAARALARVPARS